MSYKIVVDSCGELPENLKKDPHFETVSLSMDVDEYHTEILQFSISFLQI